MSVTQTKKVNREQTVLLKDEEKWLREHKKILHVHCKHQIDKFDLWDWWNFFTRQNLFIAFAYYFERSKNKSILSLLALITSIIPFFKDKWYILSHHIRTKFSIFICFESKGVSLWGLFIFHITHYCPPHNENRHFENIGQMLSIIFMLPLLQLVLDVLKPSEQNAKSIA